MSPSSAGPPDGLSGRPPARPPSSASSIGKAITSVGPGRSIQRWCRSAITPLPTSSTDSSANGLTPNRSIAKRAAAAIDASGMTVPDSLAISMPTPASPSPASVGPVGYRTRAGALLEDIPPRISVDDVSDQPVTDHIGAGQLREVHVFHTVEDVLDDPQPGHLTDRQVDLRNVPGDHDLGTETQPGEEHLHLLRSGVLRLVEDDEGIIEGATAHVGQRGDLDSPGGHQLGDRLRVEHVVQSVVQRAQVRIDLLVQGAGQKAQPLPCLDCRPGEDY